MLLVTTVVVLVASYWSTRKLASHSGRVIDERDAKPRKNGNAWAKRCKSEVYEFKSQSECRIFSREISVKVNLYDHRRL